MSSGFFRENGERGPDSIYLRSSIDPVYSLGREPGLIQIAFSSAVRGTGTTSSGFDLTFTLPLFNSPDDFLGGVTDLVLLTKPEDEVISVPP